MGEPMGELNGEAAVGTGAAIGAGVGVTRPWSSAWAAWSRLSILSALSCRPYNDLMDGLRLRASNEGWLRSSAAISAALLLLGDLGVCLVFILFTVASTRARILARESSSERGFHNSGFLSTLLSFDAIEDVDGIDWWVFALMRLAEGFVLLERRVRPLSIPSAMPSMSSKRVFVGLLGFSAPGGARFGRPRALGRRRDGTVGGEQEVASGPRRAGW